MSSHNLLEAATVQKFDSLVGDSQAKRIMNDTPDWIPSHVELTGKRTNDACRAVHVRA